MVHLCDGKMVCTYPPSSTLSCIFLWNFLNVILSFGPGYLSQHVRPLRTNFNVQSYSALSHHILFVQAAIFVWAHRTLISIGFKIKAMRKKNDLTGACITICWFMTIWGNEKKRSWIFHFIVEECRTAATATVKRRNRSTNVKGACNTRRHQRLSCDLI